MNIIDPHATGFLTYFSVGARNKSATLGLLSDLDITLVGWNLSQLFDKYVMQIDLTLAEKLHQEKMLLLAALLICGDNEALIDDPRAKFPTSIDDDLLVRSYFLHFIERLLDTLRNKLDNFRWGPTNIKGFGQELYCRLSSSIYSETKYRNPGTGAIIVFLLIVIADNFGDNICTTSAQDIFTKIWRLLLAGRKSDAFSR